MRYVPGVKISGCTSYIYTWVEIIIGAKRTQGYSVYTIKKRKASAFDCVTAVHNGYYWRVEFIILLMVLGYVLNI